MSDLGWKQTWATEAPRPLRPPPLEDLNELYCRTKVAEVQAEEQGFAGTAAALAAIATMLAEEPGVDHELVQRLSRSAPAARAGMRARKGQLGDLMRH